MENLPQLRKNIKFFAGGKNQPLVDLSSMVFDGEEVVSIEAIPEPKENNTLLKLVRDLYPGAKENPFNVTNDDRYKYRSIAYNRVSVESVLRLAFERNEEGNFVIPSSLPHPISSEDVIKELNNKFGFDMSADDITVTLTGGNHYTLAAKPNSLCFYSSAGTEIGEDPIDPEPKIASHDALITPSVTVDYDIAFNPSVPLNVNGNAVNHLDINAMDAVGLLNLRFAPIESPTNANWTVFTGLVESTVSGELITNGAEASAHNVNETIKVVDKHVNFKLIPFVRETTKPLSEDYVDFVGGVILNFPIIVAAIIDKLFLVFVDGTQTRLVDLLNGTVPGLSLVQHDVGTSRIQSTDNAPHKLILQGHIATLPALVDDSYRIIELNSVAQPVEPEEPRLLANDPLIRQELDARGRELYLVNVIPEVIPQPDPSTVTPVIIQKQAEFNAVMGKLDLSITALPWSTYNAQTYNIVGGELNYELSAHLDSLTYPNFFPFTYFIDSKAWSAITSQASEAYLGSLTTTPFNGSSVTVDITPAYLQARAVPTDGGVLIGHLFNLPANSILAFVLDWDLLGNEYTSTNTTIDVKIDHTKPSLIAPALLTPELVEELFAIESDEWKEQQLSIERVITPNNGKYTVEFKMPPGSGEMPS